jgi:ATP-dependent RNA helicase DeaD
VPINLRVDEGRPSGSFGGERKFDSDRGGFKKKKFADR